MKLIKANNMNWKKLLIWSGLFAVHRFKPKASLFVRDYKKLLSKTKMFNNTKKKIQNGAVLNANLSRKLLLPLRPPKKRIAGCKSASLFVSR